MKEREPRAWNPKVYPGDKDKHPRDQRWRVQYEDPNQNFNRRTKGGFRTKAAAQAWRAEFLRGATEGGWIDPAEGRVTFHAVATDWLATHKTTKAKTRAGYQGIIEACPFRDTQLSNITYEAIRRWVAKQAATKKPTTVRNSFYVLSAVLDYAVDIGRINTNPATKARRHLPTPIPLHRLEQARYPLTTAEAQNVCNALPEPWSMYARLVAATGMRPEEASALRLCDVDAEAGTVNINSVLVDVNGHLIREANAKTSHSIRRIELDRATTAVLANYISEHRARAARWFSDHTDHAHPGEQLPLFVGTKTGRADGKPDIDRLDFSKPMRHGNFYAKHWKAALKAAGLPSAIRFYDLRHAHISWLVAMHGQPGALSLKEIQDRAGHSSAVMTLDRYAHAPADDIERKRDAVDGLFSTTTPDNVTRLHA